MISRVLAALLLVVAAAAGDTQSGESLYKQSCATCHDAVGQNRVPPKAALRKLSSDVILNALENGVMRAQGASLTPEQRRTIAAYLGQNDKSDIGATVGHCEGSAAAAQLNLSAAGWDGWGNGITNTRFQNTQNAGLAAAEVRTLKLKWAFSLGQVARVRSQPTVFGGRVFIGSETGAVYSLDAATGCTHWAFKADNPIASSVVIAKTLSRAIAFVGDMTAKLYAIDATTGKRLWRISVDDHPAARITATPQYDNGVLYVPVSSAEEWFALDPSYHCCTFRGSVSAIDAISGRVLWKTYTIAQSATPGKTKAGKQQSGPSGVGVWDSPSIDTLRGVLYVGTGDNYTNPPTPLADSILALDLKTGHVLWSQSFTAADAWNGGCITADSVNCPDSPGLDSDFGSSPILVSLNGGRRMLLAGQKSGRLYAVDPDNGGALIWKAQVGKGGILGGIQWGSAVEGDRVYVPLSDIGLSMDKTATKTEPDPTQGGGLFAYQISTGERLWHTPPPSCGTRRPCSPSQSAAASAIPGVVFSAALDGHIRAYSAQDGSVIWDYDTARDFRAVNGLPAKGGALDGPGATIANGMVYVSSGYGFFGALPGNVLLAFSPE